MIGTVSLELELDCYVVGDPDQSTEAEVLQSTLPDQVTNVVSCAASFLC